MKYAPVLISLLFIATAFSGCVDNSVPSKSYPSIAGASNTGWKDIVPMSRLTVVEYDPDSYDDDLSYLAALPTAVFAGGDSLYTSPVLYYREPFGDATPEDRAMNDTQGIFYFMQDYLRVNGRSINRVDLIGNLPYDGDETMHYSMDPIKTSSQLALHNWRFAEEVVVAPVDSDVSDREEQITGALAGQLGGGGITEYKFQGDKLPDPVEPDLHDFEIPDGYAYVSAYLNWTWAGQTIGPDGSAATERGKDLDLQLYDMQLYNDEPGEVAASEFWNVVQGNLNHPFQPPHEKCLSYAYHTGDWQASVTYMPTKALQNGPEPDAPLPITNEDSRAFYNIRVRLMPGEIIEIPDEVEYMAGDATITLSGDPNLGLALIGPAGEEMGCIMNDEGTKTMELSSLGNGKYSVAVVSQDGNSGSYDLSYSWTHTERPVKERMLASAGEAAVFASMHNMPLIFANLGGLPSSAKDAMDTLGTKKVHLFNLGDYSDISGDFDYREWDEPGIDVKEWTSFEKAYTAIRDRSGENDIVFTTTTGWKYWYPGSDLPDGTEEKGTSIGPAAYAAAVHGSPLIVTEIHPELSAPVAWHNVYWEKAYANRLPPSVGSMVLTGHMAYDYLDEIGLDGEGPESIVTVAGHFNIGQAWDRVFVGAANPGRIFGSPVDQSMWVARNALYPLLIFANPGVDQSIDPYDGDRWTGSESTATYTITKAEEEISVEFPIAQSWVSYQHRFNERASEYWGTNYVGPSGVTPYWDESGNPIDEGNTNYPGSRGPGAYYPDLTTSEVVPFYAEKAGYSSVFTTAFDRTMENMNRGSIMWFEVMHGGHQSYGDGSGVVGFWNDDGTRGGLVPGQPDKNPWRGYEKFGCTEENAAEMLGPDTMTMSKQAGLDVFPAVGIDPTGQVYEDHDGVIIAIAEQLTQTNLVTGIQIDDALTNIHSMGFIGGSCLIANTYLQLTLVRHGSPFQVIDPWLTSWYSAFAIEMFMRQIALGETIGEAYSEGMHHVGIEYLTNQWWWDIFENVVFFGDPDMYVYAPNNAWDRPTNLNTSSSPDIGGHQPFGARDHPAEIEGYSNYVYSGIGIILIAVVAVWFIKRKR